VLLYETNSRFIYKVYLPFFAFLSVFDNIAKMGNSLL